MQLILLACLLGAATAVKIDNALVGDPFVDCQNTVVSITFRTEKPFTGRVYIKGIKDDDRCSRDFATNANQSEFSMIVQNGDCGMKRQRTLWGLYFQLIFVVSFHGTFVTKVDRAYRCMCGFHNIKRVTGMVDMSPIGTTELLDTVKTPTCTYTIRSGSPDGPALRYGKVGDKIYHVWECDDESQGFLVQGCFVNDGGDFNNRVVLLDLFGCAVDPLIHPDVEYEQSLTKAYVETHGYKFSDTSELNYMCVLELCKKSLGECEPILPPRCGRGKRSVNTILVSADAPMQATRDNELDVIAVVDILDNFETDDLDQPIIRDDFLQTLNGQTMITGRTGLIGNSAYRRNKTCLSTPSFRVLLAITVILFVTALVSSTMLCLRTRLDSSGEFESAEEGDISRQLTQEIERTLTKIHGMAPTNTKRKCTDKDRQPAEHSTDEDGEGGQLHKIQKELQDLKQASRDHDRRIAENSNRIEYNEKIQRSRNIRIYGIRATSGENLAHVFRDICVVGMKMSAIDFAKIEIENIHRAEMGRCIMVALMSRRQKTLLFSHKAALKQNKYEPSGTPVYVGDDYTKAQVIVRKDRKRVFDIIRGKGYSVKFVGANKLRVEGTEYLYTDCEDNDKFPPKR